MDNGYEFSENACAEIYQCFEQGTKMVNEAMRRWGRAILNHKDIKREEVRMNKLEANLRDKHSGTPNRSGMFPEFTVIIRMWFTGIENRRLL